MSWEAIIDQMKEWIQAQGFLTHSFVDRGDEFLDDFVTADFTMDNEWHGLDVSAIVPATAVAVTFTNTYRTVQVNSRAEFRKQGNAFPTNVSVIRQNIVDVLQHRDALVGMNETQIIEYKFTAGDWNLWNMTIKGWWL